MKEIQDAERQQLADLTELMELEVTFFEECKEVMMMLKEGWIDELSISKPSFVLVPTINITPFDKVPNPKS
jgi:hypothetical protein